MTTGLRPLLIVAGEASGDRAAAPVIAKLRGVRVFGMGGGALQREGVELVADLRGLIEHLAPAERVREAVVDHRVERLGVAHAIAEPGLRQQVRRLRHRLHAAAHADLDLAGRRPGVH